MGEGQIRRLKTILSPYLVPLIFSLLKLSRPFFPFFYCLQLTTAAIPRFLISFPHQNDVQELSGVGIIKTEIQSSLLLLTSSDLRPDNSLVLISSFLIKTKTIHNKNRWVWWHIARLRLGDQELQKSLGCSARPCLEFKKTPTELMFNSPRDPCRKKKKKIQAPQLLLQKASICYLLSTTIHGFVIFTPSSLWFSS